MKLEFQTHPTSSSPSKAKNRMAKVEVKVLEQQFLSNVTNTGLLLDIVKCVDSKDLSVQLAAVHSLRRIFVEILENKRLFITKDKVDREIKSLPLQDQANLTKLLEYKQWMVQQLHSYCKQLSHFIINEKSDVKLQAVSVRTLVEFVKREHLYRDDMIEQNNGVKVFGLTIFHLLLKSLLTATSIDVDVLLMARSEILSKPDCTYYTLEYLTTFIKDIRRRIQQDITGNVSVPENTITNLLDLLRIVELPTEEELKKQKTTFLIPIDLNRIKKNDGDDDDDDDDGSDSDSDSDDSKEEEEEVKDEPEIVNLKRKHLSAKEEKRRQQESELLAELSGMKFRKTGGSKTLTKTSGHGNTGSSLKKKRTVEQKLVRLMSHRRLYERAWLSFLSLPSISLSQHKLILKHLSTHLVQSFKTPLTLADYLTQCYHYGGVVAVLALESLFQLIVQYNLDYPKFFESLYHLCTAEVFSAKYHSKFMTLLAASLKSTNLSIYVVASFVKRLAQLSLVVPAASSLFCIAQITWLLREHAECQVLLHREKALPTITTEYGTKTAIQFNNDQDVDLQETNALSTSLWEMEILQKHYSSVVSDLATALQNPQSTSKPTALKDMTGDNSNNNGATMKSIVVNDFVNETYESLLEMEVKKLNRKQAPLAAVAPTSLWNNATTAKPGLVGTYFGFNHEEESDEEDEDEENVNDEEETY